MLSRTVIKDLKETAVIQRERHHQPRTPEPRTILAKVPAFIDGSAFDAGEFKLATEHTVVLIYVCIEEITFTTHHLFRAVADYTLSAGTPAGYRSLGIEGDDRKILCALDYLTVASLAYPNRGLRARTLHNEPNGVNHEVYDLDVHWRGNT